jgi:hypothetical protein
MKNFLDIILLGRHGPLESRSLTMYHNIGIIQWLVKYSKNILDISP